MPRIHNYQRIAFKNQPAIASRAQDAKRMIKVPNLSPELRRQEGSVKLSTLAAISLPSLGALLGVSIQLYVNKSNLIQAQDLDTSSIWHYLARPETTLDYVSAISAGVIGGLVGLGIAKLPALLDGNGDR